MEILLIVKLAWQISGKSMGSLITDEEPRNYIGSYITQYVRKKKVMWIKTEM